MNGAYARICGWLAAFALLAAGCGQILGLDEYVLVGGAGGSGGSTPGCGDGVLAPGESCDDGNDVTGDGCTSCSVDACYTCTGTVGTQSICMAKKAGELCAAGLCDDAGKCVECLVNQHCGADGYCFENACKSCDDGLMNGDETDVDCGGTHCNPCAEGKICLTNDDCATTFCTDGVCCGSACDEPCVTCIYPGFLGNCTAIDKYDEDPSYGMGEACLAAEGEACTGVTACRKALDQACTSNIECASLHCADPDMNGSKTCVKNIGDPCTLPADCYTNICTNGLCAM
ncbi:DUF4215 domain-containing protein [Polyangium sp. 6x1]|uniref:DUF4215 domain-containing protein n=1 Tax=Polyangium sp. 6x1 TaxID=3042689 RepID=UPI002482B721|nr:DUF4215 domain-containing protein [Polyangium sp. 6x1]MDI1452081.1 DUF4215 domain-containing protein [Polyangium sp. 6x1]